nr:hypothetical protein [Marinicella sp. W31]MDC2878553.1 hypothetical protein [Marinicella sp. W31]
MRMMSSFVDSELAGSAGFASAINWAPGIAERIAASRIVLEKADHAERVLDLMGDFGTDTALYNRAHSWAARLPAMRRSIRVGWAGICGFPSSTTPLKTGPMRW